MARYKHIDTSPKFLPVDLTRQLLPGTFEHALNHLLDHERKQRGQKTKGSTLYLIAIQQPPSKNKGGQRFTACCPNPELSVNADVIR